MESENDEQASLSVSALSQKSQKLQDVHREIAEKAAQMQKIQARIEQLMNKKQQLQQEKKNLEEQAKYLQRVCNQPDINLKGSSFSWSEKLHQLRTSRFGITTFRDLQEETINCTMSGRDAVLIMPTGGGKSLCYQLPALVSKGFTLVVSPLISLMEDQVMALRDLGINAVLLSSSASRDKVKMVHNDMINPTSLLKLLYVTPEKIAKSKRFMAQLQKGYDKGLLARVAVDEVHCCSQWGHDFRPDYKVLGILKRQFSSTPLLGLTATATLGVLEDVKTILNIPGCQVFRSSYNRANLFYEVQKKPSSQVECLDKLESLIKSNFNDQSGIIYCFSRKESEVLASALKKRGIVSEPYHADLQPEHRSGVHQRWKANKTQVVVATTAFGMGIDKPDVRFVIHHSMSKSMENYYQESGRAGRDGKPAKCIVLYGFVDYFRQSTMVVMEQTGLEKLSGMVAYCVSIGQCRRGLIANHFEETWNPDVECNNMCDSCQANVTANNSEDVSNLLRVYYSIIEKAAAKDQRLTGLKLVDLARKEKLQTKSYAVGELQSILIHLLLEGYFRQDFHFTPYSTISYIIQGPRSTRFLSSGGSKVTVPFKVAKSPEGTKKILNKKSRSTVGSKVSNVSKRNEKTETTSKRPLGVQKSGEKDQPQQKKRKRNGVEKGGSGACIIASRKRSQGVGEGKRLVMGGEERKGVEDGRVKGTEDEVIVIDDHDSDVKFVGFDLGTKMKSGQIATAKLASPASIPGKTGSPKRSLSQPKGKTINRKATQSLLDPGCHGNSEPPLKVQKVKRDLDFSKKEEVGDIPGEIDREANIESVPYETSETQRHEGKKKKRTKKDANKIYPRL